MKFEAVAQPALLSPSGTRSGLKAALTAAAVDPPGGRAAATTSVTNNGKIAVGKIIRSARSQSWAPMILRAATAPGGPPPNSRVASRADQRLELLLSAYYRYPSGPLPP
jgi:hypothetical protein